MAIDTIGMSAVLNFKQQSRFRHKCSNIMDQSSSELRYVIMLPSFCFLHFNSKHQCYARRPMSKPPVPFLENIHVVYIRPDVVNTTTAPSSIYDNLAHVSLSHFESYSA